MIKLKDTDAGEDMEQLEISGIAGGNANCTATLEKQFDSFL